MASLSSFRIFPSAVEATEIDLSKPQLSTYQRRSTELKGVAFHVSRPGSAQSQRQTTSRSAQAPQRSQSPSPQSTVSHIKTRWHQRKRSSAPNLHELARPASSVYNSPDDLLHVSASAKPSLALRIPSSTYSASTYSEPQSCVRSTPATSIADTPQTDYSAVSSTVDSKRQSHAFPPRSQSLRSATSATSRATNFSRQLPIIPASPEERRDIRSIFPQYDPTKPLSQQNYYPQRNTAARSVTVPALESKQKDNRHSQQFPATPASFTGVLTHGYESVPELNADDLSKLWLASTRLGACGGRKIHLPIHCTPGTSTTYNIGSTSCPLFTAKVETPKQRDGALQLSLSKTNPKNNETHLLTNISLPVQSRTQATYGTDNTHIFPHQAAVDALTAASNSPHAAEIARFDPQATSRAAETLAKEAVNDAHRSYTSELVRITRRHSTVTKAEYKLQHSIIGDMVISVTQSTARGSAFASRQAMRIVLHHPSATPAAIAAETLALLSVDLGRNACIIDLPSILGLEAEYMLDTALSAVVATLVMEQDKIGVPEAMVFEAPPTKAVNDKVKKQRAKLSKQEKSANKKQTTSRGIFWPLRKTGVTELDEKVDEMPPLAKTAVAAVELSLHGAFWLLEKGAKTLDEKGRGRL